MYGRPARLSLAPIAPHHLLARSPLPAPPAPQVLRQASEGVFVPLTVGGGIRGFTDSQGVHYSALEVAAEYFRWAALPDSSQILGRS